MKPELMDKVEAAFTHFPVRRHLLYVVEVGSEAYNLRLVDSGDHDLFVVVLPPPEFEIGLQTWEECQVNADGLDLKFYSLRKYVNLLLKGNPNVLETLWVGQAQQLLVGPTIARLLISRRWFSTQQAAKAMAGYASSQLARMEAGKAEALGAGRKALVAEMGYDTKMAHHALRILRMGIDFAADGRLQVYRTHDADYLRAVKIGLHSLEHVKAEGARLFEEFNEARSKSTLPEQPNREDVENYLVWSTFFGWSRLAGGLTDGKL